MPDSPWLFGSLHGVNMIDELLIQSGFSCNGARYHYQRIHDQNGELRIYEQLCRLKLNAKPLIECIGYLTEQQRLNLDLISILSAQRLLCQDPLIDAVSINIEPSNLTSGHFLQMVSELQSSFNNRIIVEVTERGNVEDMDLIILGCKQIQSLGFSVALDDFTTGINQLGILSQLDVDYVKIDGSLIKEVENNVRARAILSSLLALEEKLSFKVIAEHIETSSQYQLLKSMGIQFYQGFYLSTPHAIKPLNPHVS